MTQTDKQACIHRIWRDYSRYPCSRKASEGKPYCFQHDPEHIKAQQLIRDAKWKARHDAETEVWHRRAMETKACEGLSTEALEAGVVADLLEALRSVARLLEPNGYPVHLSIVERQAIKAAIAKAVGT